MNDASERKELNRFSVFGRWAVFLAGLAGIFTALGIFFQPVWFEYNNYDIADGFYKEPRNTIQAAFFGSSVMANGADPMKMYEDYGICGYNFGTAVQPVLVSYYWLEEVYRLHPESLKAAVVEVTQFDAEPDPPRYHMGLDYMHTSSVKLRAIRDYTDGSLSEIITNAVPLLSYHGRWGELGRDDYRKLDYSSLVYFRGYHFNKNRNEYNTKSYDKLHVPDTYIGEDTEAAQLNSESEYYFHKMVDFCREKQIRLILIKTPTGKASPKLHLAVRKAAAQNGIDFFDFNYEPLLSDNGFNYAIDFVDHNHMNFFGAFKLSAWLGKYLSEQCGISDVRGSGNYAFLEDQLNEYHNNVTDVVSLDTVTDPAEYLSRTIKRDNCSVLLAVKGDASKSMSDSQKQAFEEMGLSKLASLGYQDAYLSVIDHGNVLFEESGSESELVRKGELPDGALFTLTSGGENSGNTVSCRISDIERLADVRGLHIVVYDNDINDVIHTKKFDLYASDTVVSYDPEEWLREATSGDRNPNSLTGDLRKLYLYDLRCKDARTLAELRKNEAGSGVLGYLKAYCGKEGYACFLAVKGDAAGKLSDEVRSAFLDCGLKELAKLELSDSYMAVVANGKTVYEKRDRGTGVISTGGALASGDNAALRYKMISGGDNSGNTAIILINGTECSDQSRGINLVIWNTVTNMKVASVSFDSHEKEMLLPKAGEERTGQQ